MRSHGVLTNRVLATSPRHNPLREPGWWQWLMSLASPFRGSKRMRTATADEGRVEVDQWWEQAKDSTRPRSAARQDIWIG